MNLKYPIFSSFLFGFGSSVPGAILVNTVQILSFLVNANADGNLVFTMVINMFILGIFGLVLPIKSGTSSCGKNSVRWMVFILGFICGFAAFQYAIKPSNL